MPEVLAVLIRGSVFILLGLMFVGCATATSSDQVDGVSESSAIEQNGIARTSRSARGRDAERWPSGADSGVVMPSALSWTGDDAVFVGFVDGMVVTLKPAVTSYDVRFKKLSSPVMTFSPGGEFAVLATDPVSLVNLDNKEVYLRLNRIAEVRGTAFSTDGSLWFVTDVNNKVHVWETGRLSAPKTGEDIRAVIGRETSDYSVQFPSVGRRLMPADARSLFFSDANGMVFRWDTRVQEIQTLMRMKGEILSFSRRSEHFAVTSSSGQLRIINETNNRLLTWTHNATGVQAQIIEGDASSVVVIDKQSLSLRDLKTGEVIWQRELPDDVKHCGLSAKSDRIPILLCLNGALALISPTDGALLSIVRNKGGEVDWRDAYGEEIEAR